MHLRELRNGMLCVEACVSVHCSLRYAWGIMIIHMWTDLDTHTHIHIYIIESEWGVTGHVTVAYIKCKICTRNCKCVSVCGVCARCSRCISFLMNAYICVRVCACMCYLSLLQTLERDNACRCACILGYSNYQYSTPSYSCTIAHVKTHMGTMHTYSV
jgi:hypothetical protein